MNFDAAVVSIFHQVFAFIMIFEWQIAFGLHYSFIENIGETVQKGWVIHLKYFAVLYEIIRKWVLLSFLKV